MRPCDWGYLHRFQNLSFGLNLGKSENRLASKSAIRFELGDSVTISDSLRALQLGLSLERSTIVTGVESLPQAQWTAKLCVIYHPNLSYVSKGEGRLECAETV